jgi:hypothetical protein
MLYCAEATLEMKVKATTAKLVLNDVFIIILFFKVGAKVRFLPDKQIQMVAG